MARFKEISSSSKINHQNCVIMGRKTYMSIPTKFRPLAGRLNIVITSNHDFHNQYSAPTEVLVAQNLQHALDLAFNEPHSIPVDKVFVIGGGGLLCESIDHPQCENIFYTTIFNDIECDTFIKSPSETKFKKIVESDILEQNGFQFQFLTYVRIKE